MDIVIKQLENCELVEMLIDSGSEFSIINKLVWDKLGRPELTPTHMRVIMASGASVDLLGQFTANIIFDQHEYELPLHVMNKDDAHNVIGWRCFPILDLNWNTIFGGKKLSEMKQISHKLEKENDFSKSSQQRIIEHFYVTLNVEDVDLPMMLDTGASVSLIGIAQWEKLGKPKLKPDKLHYLTDNGDNKIDIAGKCWVKVKYLGRHRLLPLRVINRNCDSAVVGTNWFHSLEFDFNSIFYGQHDSEEAISPSGSAGNAQHNGRKGKCQKIIQNAWTKAKAWFSAWLFEDVPKCVLFPINIKKSIKN